MADVFISYSQKRAEPAETLARQLKEKGIEVWWDTRLTSGQAFDDAIRKELDNADAAIVIWTPESVNSQYVKMEAGIAYAWEKLITVRTGDLLVEHIPEPFRGLHADVVTDVDRVMIALGEKGVLPRGSTKKRLSRADVLAALGQLDPSLPAKVDAFLRKCQDAGFRIACNRSIMIKAAITNFEGINFGTLFPYGKFQTNYISDSSERIGDKTIAGDYLDNLAALLDGGAVYRDGPPWTWRVEVFGEMPAIAKILAREDEWIALMRTARQRFTEAAAARMIKQSA
jgi:hypothetical protein